MIVRDMMDTAHKNLKRHRLRSILSILGIIIGIGSFTIMYSIGETARQKAIETMKEMGSDVITVNIDAGASQMFTINHIKDIKTECPSIAHISPELIGQTIMPVNGELSNFQVKGVLPSYFDMFKLQTTAGRLINEIDVTGNHQVCLLGETIANKLFKFKNPLDEYVAVKGYLFKVIGILKKFESIGLASVNEDILIPLSFAERLFDNKEISSLSVRASNAEEAMAQIQRYFSLRKFEEESVRIESQEVLLRTQKKYTSMFSYILWAISSISLIVGGIGIMNIMLVSVTERLKEIGIRRAVGATRSEIKLQFLSESILLCLLGAAGGTFLGYIGTRVVGFTFNFQPVFSGKLLLISLLIASALGIVCGTYPAARAAAQDPTRVLRNE